MKSQDWTLGIAGQGGARDAAGWSPRVRPWWKISGESGD